MKQIKKLEKIIKELDKVLLENVELESTDDDVIIIKKDGSMIHETQNAIPALRFLQNKKLVKNREETIIKCYRDLPMTHAIANSAGKSELSFHEEIKHATEEKVNVKRTIMEVEKRGKVHVLKADFLATSMRIRPGDIAKCPALGMGDMNCKILRLASVFSTRVVDYLDEKNDILDAGNGGGIAWVEMLEKLKTLDNQN